MEQMALLLYDFKHALILGHDASKVYRHHHLRLLGDGIGQLVVVHLPTILLGIDHHQLGTQMVYHRCGGRVGIGGHNDLVARPHVEQTEHHLHRCRGRVEAHRLCRMHIF